MNNKKVFGKFLMVLLPILILISAIFIVSKVGKKRGEISIQAPVETITPIPKEIRPPSRWATDSAVLQTEESLKNISSQLETIDLKEANLAFPLLDTKINF